ncbi:hypothetical protein ACUOCP_47055, partial [Escherichia sp. R-CC3]
MQIHCISSRCRIRSKSKFLYRKRIPYNHAIWHGFVLGGSVCHFLAIYLYIGQA